MNSFLLGFADGTFFFVGMGIVFLGALVFLSGSSRFLCGVATVLILGGIVLVAISATPLPRWAYAIWGLGGVVALAAGNTKSLTPAQRLVRLAAVAVAALTTAGLCLAELPHHRAPRIAVPAGTTAYVVGDSISSGIGIENRCWPAVLGDMSSLPVVNLARPGATLRSAAQQVEEIVQPDSLVILEIGGTDIIGHAEAVEFRNQLDGLLSMLARQRHRIVMFELPLFPFQNAFGRAQRQLAARHGVTLIPKRYLAKVFGLKGGTLDGLHLSQEGHNALARLIAELIEAETGPGTGIVNVPGVNIRHTPALQ